MQPLPDPKCPSDVSLATVLIEHLLISGNGQMLNFQMKYEFCMFVLKPSGLLQFVLFCVVAI